MRQSGCLRRGLLGVVAAAWLVASTAHGDVNMSGTWDVTAFSATVPYIFTQTGTDLWALSNNEWTWQGSIDPSTGVFTLPATDITVAIVGSCGVFNATVTPDGMQFSGIFSFAPLQCGGVHPPSCACGTFTDEPVSGVRVTGPNVCGNGTLENGEQCDDGNLLAGDCCSPTCSSEAAGTACAADASPCTFDACDGAGQCAHGPFPACRTASRPGALRAKRNLPSGGRVRFLWSDDSGGTTTADFGDPTTLSTVRLCLYSGSALVLDATAPPAACGTPPCWSAKPTGFTYRAPGSVPGGLSRVVLRARGGGRSTLSAKGSGSALAFLGDPTSPLRAQLHVEDIAGNRCWDLP